MSDLNKQDERVNVEEQCPKFSSELIEISDDESDMANEDERKDSGFLTMDYYSFCHQLSNIVPPFVRRYILKLQKKAASSPGSYFMKLDQDGLMCADVEGLLENDLISGKAISIWFQLIQVAYPDIGVTDSAFAELDMKNSSAVLRHMETFQNKERIMITVYTTAPRHWFLAYVKTNEATVQIFDSLKSSNTSRYLPVCERISRILAAISNRTDDYAEIDVRLVECAQQPCGSVDCGLYLTRFAKYVAVGEVPTADKFDRLYSKTMREIMYWELRFGRIQKQPLRSRE